IVNRVTSCYRDLDAAATDVKNDRAGGRRRSSESDRAGGGYGAGIVRESDRVHTSRATDRLDDADHLRKHRAAAVLLVSIGFAQDQVALKRRHRGCRELLADDEDSTQRGA